MDLSNFGTIMNDLTGAATSEPAVFTLYGLGALFAVRHVLGIAKNKVGNSFKAISNVLGTTTAKKYALNATSLGLMLGGTALAGQGFDADTSAMAYSGIAAATYGFMMIFGVNCD